jgi:hypothetical protein
MIWGYDRGLSAFKIKRTILIPRTKRTVPTNSKRTVPTNSTTEIKTKKERKK